MERETESAPKGNKSGGLGAKAIAVPTSWIFHESVRLLSFFLLVFVFIVFFSLLVLFNRGCPLEDFQCWDYTCIPKEKFCDGVVSDCSQGEDEEEAYCQMRGQLNSLKDLFKDLAVDHACELDGIPGVSIKKSHRSKWLSRKTLHSNSSFRRKNSAKTMKILTRKFFNRVNRNLLRGNLMTNLFHEEKNVEGKDDKMKNNEKTKTKEKYLESRPEMNSESTPGDLHINSSYFYPEENRESKENVTFEESISEFTKDNSSVINNFTKTAADNITEETKTDYISAVEVNKKKQFLTNKSMNREISHLYLEDSLNQTFKSLNYSDTLDQTRQKYQQLLSNETDAFLEFFIQNYVTKSIDKNSNFDVAKNEEIKLSNATKDTPNGTKRRNDINVTNPYFEKLRKDKYKELLTKGIYNDKVSEGRMKEFYDSLHKFLLNAHSLKIYPDISYKVMPSSKYKNKVNKLNLENFVDSILSVFPDDDDSASNATLVNHTENSSTENPFHTNYSLVVNISNSGTLATPFFTNLTTQNLSTLNFDEDDDSLPEIVEIFRDAINSSFMEFINELEPSDLENLTYFETTQKEIGATEQTVWKLEPAFNELLIKVFEDAKNSYLESSKKELNSSSKYFKYRVEIGNSTDELPDSDRVPSLVVPLRYTTTPKQPPPDKVLPLENSRPDCYCELRTVVKCSNATSVPANISGGMTKLVLSNNRISEIDSSIMRQYQSLKQGLYLQNNLITSIPPRVFSSQKILKRLFLHENLLTTIHADSCIGLSQLEIFHLYENNLSYIDLHCFQHTPLLHTLLLSRNRLTLVDEEFPSLLNLKFLDLQKNKIPVIQQQLFAKLTSLKTLSLQHNKIASIHPGAFENLKNLEDLDLSNNRILKNVANVFNHLSSLQSLNLRGVQLDSTSSIDYQNLTSLKRVFFPRLRYCAFVEQVDHCEPRSDGITSKEDLMQSMYLRLCVWAVAFVTLAGNFAVLLCRGISRNDEKVLVLFIKNLAMADLLMGIYLVIVGIQDQITRGSFFRHANWWTSSKWCTLAGCLALVSSEASVFILAYMSLQRYLYITRTLRSNELTMRFARKSLLVIWLTSLMLAVFPIWGMTSFYGMNAMCFPLHISEPYFEGWQFSAFVFLGLNSFCMIVIIASYLGLFINIKITRSKTPLSKTDMSFVLRFLFIVLTDCICWMPILACKLVALAEVPVTGEVYAWLVVLVVPINSAINPILYTFSTSHFLAHMQKVVRKVNPSKMRKHSDSSGTFRFSSTRSRHSFLQGKVLQTFQTTFPLNSSSLSDTHTHEIPIAEADDDFSNTEYEKPLKKNLEENIEHIEDQLTIEITDKENLFPSEGEESRFLTNTASSPSSPAIRLTCRLKNVGSLSLTVVREIKNDEQLFYNRQEYDVSPRKGTFPGNIKPESLQQRGESNYTHSHKRFSSSENDIARIDLQENRLDRDVRWIHPTSCDQSAEEVSEDHCPLCQTQQELHQSHTSHSSNDHITENKSPKYNDENRCETLRQRDSSNSLLTNQESDQLILSYSDDDKANFIDG